MGLLDGDDNQHRLSFLLSSKNPRLDQFSREGHAKCLEITPRITFRCSFRAWRNLASEMLKAGRTNVPTMKSNHEQEVGAFTITELLIVVGCLLVLSAIILPQLARPHGHDCRINCTNNLKQLALAFRSWALDNNDRFPMELSVTNGGARELLNAGNVFSVFQVMSNELSTPKILFCPTEDDPKRIAASTFQSTVPQGSSSNLVPFTGDRNVSYFVGVDATQTNAQMILTGDRNLAIAGVPVRHGLLDMPPKSAVTWFKPRHNNGGNIALSDGSVQQFSSAAVGNLFKRSGVATNRLAIP